MKKHLSYIFAALLLTACGQPEGHRCNTEIADYLSQVWFSKDYTIPVDSGEYWLSESASDELPAEKLYKNPDVLNDPATKAKFQAEQDDFKNRKGWFTDDCDLWFSTHTSVYNIATHTLHVLVHEGLSGQTAPYEATLAGSHFEKPLLNKKPEH